MMLVVKNPPANEEDARDLGSISELERFSGKGDGSRKRIHVLKEREK